MASASIGATRVGRAKYLVPATKDATHSPEGCSKTVSPVFLDACYLLIPDMSGALKRFLPLFDRVLVQRAVPVTQTKAGILIPEASQKKELTATVVAVGPGALGENGKAIPPAVQVGDEVFLPEFGGTKVTLDEKEYFLYRDSDFLAKFKAE